MKVEQETLVKSITDIVEEQGLKRIIRTFGQLPGELRIGNWLENMGLSSKEFGPSAIGGEKVP